MCGVQAASTVVQSDCSTIHVVPAGVCAVQAAGAVRFVAGAIRPVHHVTSCTRNSEELHRKQHIGLSWTFQLIYHCFIFYIISFHLLIYVVVLIITAVHYCTI